MKVKLVRIGNSWGIRIPKAILEQCGLREAAELRVEKGRLVIAREQRPTPERCIYCCSVGKATSGGPATFDG